MAQVYRKRKGVITEVNHIKPKKISVGDRLHKMYYDRDGTLKSEVNIKKEVFTKFK
jgi:hypothetical protein